MLLEIDNYYKIFVYHNFFSPEECRQIINLPGNEFPSPVQEYDRREKMMARNYRRSTSKDIKFQRENLWIFKRILGIFRETNEKYFQSSFSKIVGTQVIRYETGDFFSWHADTGIGVAAQRKLSSTTFLTKPGEYEGGELVFMPEMPAFEANQGTIIIFPAYLMHQVCPVTNGIRHALIAWGA